jgi:two-component system phosphate regulon response regulator OmpR
MHKAKILVIDDDFRILRWMQSVLGSEGYQVATVSDATFASSVAIQEKPDLILLDLTLPGGDGYLVMERLTNFDNRTPIIVMSGRGDEKNRQRALQSGAKAYFEKPADFKALLETIENLLEKTAT